MLKFETHEPFKFSVIDNYLEKSKISNAIDDIANISIWNDPNYGFKERLLKQEKDKYTKHENYNIDYEPTHNRFVADKSQLGPNIQNVLKHFESPEVLQKFKLLANVDDLFFDKDLRGGGLQKSGNGAFLKVHIDNNWNPRTESYPILNVILFMSDWCEEYGGSLELWTQTHCFKKILPIKNRLIIRENSDLSYHGFPTPIQCPENVFRYALVMFYHTKKMIPENKRLSAVWI